MPHAELVAALTFALAAALVGGALARRLGFSPIMGYLLAGPVGTGKTFLVSCFAGEIGIPVVKFLNFRSQWQGVTEANLEKIFNLLKALWPVAVMIDEADTFLGNRDSGGDSGTSSRVFGSIASFMGNTQYRGKIVWFLMTAPPWHATSIQTRGPSMRMYVPLTSTLTPADFVPPQAT